VFPKEEYNTTFADASGFLRKSTPPTMALPPIFARRKFGSEHSGAARQREVSKIIVSGKRCIPAIYHQRLSAD
jgi:hypothetical protein